MQFFQVEAEIKLPVGPLFSLHLLVIPLFYDYSNFYYKVPGAFQNTSGPTVCKHRLPFVTNKKYLLVFHLSNKFVHFSVRSYPNYHDLVKYKD